MSYDFNKREDFEYSHSFDYLGGVGLGKAEVASQRERDSKRGKYDMVPVAAPDNVEEKEEIIRASTMIHRSNNRSSLLEKIAQLRDPRMEFVWNASHRHHSYFQWALHCIDREVKDWTSILPSTHRSESKYRAPDNLPTKTERSFQIDDWVEISGIQARPELNGKRGQIKHIDSKTHRFQIEFSDILQTVSISESKCRHSDGSSTASSRTTSRKV